MSHQDTMSEFTNNTETIKRVVDWLLPASLFRSMTMRAGTTWTARMLATAALLWGAGAEPTLDGRFQRARKIVKKVFRWKLPPGLTYQGFIKALNKWHAKLLLPILSHLRAKTKEDLPECWRIAGYVVFAGDGSRVEVPRTKSNEDAYAPHRKKKEEVDEGRAETLSAK